MRAAPISSFFSTRMICSVRDALNGVSPVMSRNQNLDFAVFQSAFLRKFRAIWGDNWIRSFGDDLLRFLVFRMPLANRCARLAAICTRSAWRLRRVRCRVGRTLISMFGPLHTVCRCDFRSLTTMFGGESSPRRPVLSGVV